MSNSNKVGKKSSYVVAVTDANVAAAKGDLTQLDCGLTAKQLLACKDRRGWRPLHHAANKGHLDAVVFLLGMPGLVSALDNDKNTPLHRAVKFPHCVEEMLKNQECLEHVDDKNKLGCTALVLAAASGCVGSVIALLDSGASISTTDKRKYTALAHAAQSGHANIVNAILTHPVMQEHTKLINADAKGTPLMLAARNGHIDVSRSLIKGSAEVNAKAKTTGATALWEAAANGHVGVVHLLVEHGASITAACTKPPASVTALYQACLNGHAPVLEMLVKRMQATGARTSFRRLLNRQCGTDRLTAMHAACMNGHASVVTHLLHAEELIDAAPVALERDATTVSAFSALSAHANVADGPLVEVVGSNGQTPLHLACAGNHVDVVRVLLPILRAQAAGDMCTFPLDNDGVSPVHVAAAEGHPETLQLLCTHLQSAAEQAHDTQELFHTDNAGETALLKACRNGHEECVEILLTGGHGTAAIDGGHVAQAGVNALSDGPTGVTALHEAVQYNHVGIVRKLLAAQADPAAVSKTQWHALHVAAYHGSKDILEAVLASGTSDVNVVGGPDNLHATPLMRCCCHDQEEALLFLLTQGADPTAVDAHGATALHYAATVGVVPHRCAERLVAAPAKLAVDGADAKGQSALLVAAAHGHVDFCIMLVQKLHANVLLQDRRGWTVLHHACHTASLDLVDGLQHVNAEGVRGIINQPDSTGDPPLFLAIDSGAFDLVARLFDVGADRQQRGRSGQNATGRAVTNHLAKSGSGIDYVQMLAVLLRQGVPANVEDDTGLTAYAQAKAAGDAALVHCFEGGYQ
eukprot:m.76703 g.76703  ORF g.76703 m.76703 type:complete len:808 (+) comp16187_c0_seq6:62-2485(+)